MTSESQKRRNQLASDKRIAAINKQIQWMQEKMPGILERAKQERAVKEEGGVWAETDEDEKRIRRERGL